MKSNSPVLRMTKLDDLRDPTTREPRLMSLSGLIEYLKEQALKNVWQTSDALYQYTYLENTDLAVILIGMLAMTSPDSPR